MFFVFGMFFCTVMATSGDTNIVGTYYYAQMVNCMCFKLLTSDYDYAIVIVIVSIVTVTCYYFCIKTLVR